MNIIRFIFLLGVNFSIFAFLWGMIMLIVRFLIRSLSAPNSAKNNNVEYILRIIKYFLLVSVTANFIHHFYQISSTSSMGISYIALGVIVFALYLLGKFQNRNVLAQLGNLPMAKRFFPQIDLKVERFIMLGALGYFVACMLVPGMVNNGVVVWFTENIIAIYDTAFIGWIFAIIAFFFLVNTFMRAANVIGRIINGQPILDPNVKVNMNQQQRPFNPFENFTQESESEQGFSDYEDVTEEDEEKEGN